MISGACCNWLERVVCILAGCRLRFAKGPVSPRNGYPDGAGAIEPVVQEAPLKNRHGMFFVERISLCFSGAIDLQFSRFPRLTQDVRLRSKPDVPRHMPSPEFFVGSRLISASGLPARAG